MTKKKKKINVTKKKKTFGGGYNIYIKGIGQPLLCGEFNTKINNASSE
jgi:hypothetical protein